MGVGEKREDYALNDKVDDLVLEHGFRVRIRDEE